MLGRQIESPAEAAARIAAPPASLISVPVEMRELSSAVITRGTIEFDQTTGIEVSGSETGSSIITRLTKSEGDDLLGREVVLVPRFASGIPGRLEKTAIVFLGEEIELHELQILVGGIVQVELVKFFG